jgi:DNA polymerase IV (DinB-like DNA polymerase)
VYEASSKNRQELKYYVGCSGWRKFRLEDRVGDNGKGQEEPFYPSALDHRDYLSYYSKVFDFVEVNLYHGTNRIASDYDNSKKLPNKFTFKKWADATPDNFRFAIKIPLELLSKDNNNNRISINYDSNYPLDEFLEELAPLEEKILALVIQTPVAVTLAKNGRDWLDRALITCTNHRYSAALEFDSVSWYQDLTYHILKKHNAALVWSDKFRQPYVTGDFLYLRLGEPKYFKKWLEKVKEKERESESEREFNSDNSIDSAIIVLDTPNNANTVLKLLNLPKREYGSGQWIGRAIFHVDLNSFYPSCEELRDSSLKGKPHAVIMTDQQDGNITRGVVASCSYEAKKVGVKSAMPLSRALELSSDLILRAVDMTYYKQISDNVMRILETYADIVEQASIDEAYLDCTKKIISLSDITIEQYASGIKKAIKEQSGLLCSIGVASTKSAAKIASDYQKPDGLTVIYPNELQKFLEPLEVERISGIGTKTEKVLKKEMSIETMGQLARCDVQMLMERFGKKVGVWMWQVANGQDNEPVAPREDYISLGTEYTLHHFTNSKEKILDGLNSLVDEMFEKVVRNGYEFKTVGVKLVRADYTIETRETSYPDYQKKKESISSVISGLLDRFSFFDEVDKNSSRAPVKKVGLRVSNLVRAGKKASVNQKSLLDYL